MEYNVTESELFFTQEAVRTVLAEKGVKAEKIIVHRFFSNIVVVFTIGALKYSFSASIKGILKAEDSWLFLINKIEETYDSKKN